MMILHLNMSKKTAISVAHGDVIGPEMREASFHGKQGFTLSQNQ